jgi:hypothetical protein
MILTTTKENTQQMRHTSLMITSIYGEAATWSYGGGAPILDIMMECVAL